MDSKAELRSRFEIASLSSWIFFEDFGFRERFFRIVNAGMLCRLRLGGVNEELLIVFHLNNSICFFYMNHRRCFNLFEASQKSL